MIEYVYICMYMNQWTMMDVYNILIPGALALIVPGALALDRSTLVSFPNT